MSALSNTWKIAALLVASLLPACVGDDCYSGDQCLSGSCTWGTCDSALVNAAFERDDDTYEEEDEPTVVRTCVQASSCEYLLEVECEHAPGCERVMSFCSTAASCDLFSPSCNDCGSRDEAACTGDCEPFYECRTVDLGCGELDEHKCAKRLGCELHEETY